METLKKKIPYGTTQKPNNRAPYAKKVIAISSGKGGVGKSTVAANIAVGLAQEGLHVGLLDADIYGPSIPRLLGIENERLSWNEDDKMLPSENFGIKVMSVGLTTPKNDTPLVWRSSVAVSALMQFLDDVAWGELDVLVIDMPPGTGDVQLTMAQELPLSGVILVTTPQMLSTDDVSRAIVMFQDIHVPILGLVENMSYFIAPDTGKKYDIFGEGGAQRLCDTYTVPLLGEIPLTQEIRLYADHGKVPVALGDPHTKTMYQAIIKQLKERLF
jgi:ATP-binding protein involved in chromosome partitioning